MERNSDERTGVPDGNETLRERARAVFIKYPTLNACQNALSREDLDKEERTIIEYVIRKFELRQELARNADTEYDISVGTMSFITRYLETLSPRGAETDERRRDILRLLISELEERPRASQGHMQTTYQRPIPTLLTDVWKTFTDNILRLRFLSQALPDESPLNMFPRNGRSIREMLRDFFEGTEEEKESGEEQKLHPTSTERILGRYYAEKKARTLASSRRTTTEVEPISTQVESASLKPEGASFETEPISSEAKRVSSEVEPVSIEAFYHTTDYRDLRIEYRKICESAGKNGILKTFLETLFAEIPTLEKKEREIRIQAMTKLVQLVAHPPVNCGNDPYMIRAIDRHKAGVFLNYRHTFAQAMKFFKGTTDDDESRIYSEAFYQYQRYLVSILEDKRDTECVMPSLALLSLWRKDEWEKLGMTEESFLDVMHWNDRLQYLESAKVEGGSITFHNGATANEKLTAALQDEMGLIAAELIAVVGYRSGVLMAESRSLDLMPIVDNRVGLRHIHPQGGVETARQRCEHLNTVGRISFQDAFREITQKRNEIETLKNRLKGPVSEAATSEIVTSETGQTATINLETITVGDIERISLIPLNDSLVDRLTEDRKRLSELRGKEETFMTNHSLVIRTVNELISYLQELTHNIETETAEWASTPQGFFASKKNKKKAVALKTEIQKKRQEGTDRIEAAKNNIEKYLEALDLPETSAIREECEKIEEGVELYFPFIVESFRSIATQLKTCFPPFLDDLRSIDTESARLFEILEAVEAEISRSLATYRELAGDSPSPTTFEHKNLDPEIRREFIAWRRQN
ncbi:hypothetical protein HYV57_05935 [Candidatus Peregrinibacteria bacterium]|nr:hypothetical protein [Candidatus Peregrinibacteria bacterium]